MVCEAFIFTSDMSLLFEGLLLIVEPLNRMLNIDCFMV